MPRAAGNAAALAGSAPAQNASAVTPHDTNLLPGGETVGLYIGGAGNVVVNMAGDLTTAITFTAVPVGAILPIAVARVRTATSATLIVALYD